MRFRVGVSALAGAATLALAPSSLAHEAATVLPLQAEPSFESFTPRQAGDATRLDWKAWDDALDWFVLGLGPSLRQKPTIRLASIGSNLVFGHNSPYRLEGNRVAFQFLEAKQLAALTEYRQDLERIGSEVDIATLPRNEQLAFWINLHNVAIIEQVALAYPVMSPRKVKLGGVTLDEARFITVGGIAISPKDIRTRIVYPNWKDPRVIYGFFRGDIGGPSIRRKAYTGKDVARQLGDNATEFVNALRGVSRSGGTLKVSEIYEEARPYYFSNWEADLRAHLADFAESEVSAALNRTSRISADIYETDIADLSKGEREPAYTQSDECEADPGAYQGYRPGFREAGDCPVRIDIPIAVQRFEAERKEKIRKLIKAGKIGTVTVREVEPEGQEVE